MTFLQLAIGYIIGRVLVSVLFIPAYFRGDLFTSYELLQRRFGTRVKTLSAVIFLITRSLADGIRLFTTALVISIVTQVPVTWVVIVLGAAMIVYTMRGGVSAVIWTDVVQMFVYIAGAGAVAIALLGRIDGGWAEVVRVGSETGRFVVLDASLDFTQGLHAVGRPARRRRADARRRTAPINTWCSGCCRRNRRRPRRRGLVLSGFIVFAQFILFLLIGVMLYTHYQQVPLPQALTRPDQILPIFVVSELQERPRRLHRRRDRRRGAVAVAQRDGGDHGQRFLPAVRQSRPPIRPRRCASRSRRRWPGASCSWRWRSARSS